MADVRPFRGLRYDLSRVRLADALCPPYDVIGDEQARRLRRGRHNAVHLELPAGFGSAKYRAAARLWRDWRADGVLIADPRPAFYVVEERFRLGGRARVRRGFLGALGVYDRAARHVVAHERTLPKPKADRLRMLRAVRANLSPIFGVFADPAALVRRGLAAAARGAPVARGRADGGVDYRLWRLDEPAAVAAIRRALSGRRLLIADGHHRFEVSRAYWKGAPRPENETVLAYLCPDEDAGLVVLPTHRVVAGDRLGARAQRLCRLERCRSLAQLLRRLARAPSPYAFGLLERRAHRLAVPRRPDGCRSGLSVEWVGRHILAETPPERIAYTPDAARAARQAGAAGAAVFIKPFAVAQVRRAVDAVGLLPPKSTYFYPKIATGLVFKPLERQATEP